MATQKVNTTIGRQNCTPSELFTGRKAFSDESVRISAGELLGGISKDREAKRSSAERANYRKLRNTEKSKSPFNNPDLNSTAAKDKIDLSKLKISDKIKLNLEFDKNHPERSGWWTVIHIDFKNQKVRATLGGKKSGTRNMFFQGTKNLETSFKNKSR